jgi:hypothetical protein
MPLHLSQISIFIRKVGQSIHKVSHMRVTILLFLMALASQSSAEETQKSRIERACILPNSIDCIMEQAIAGPLASEKPMLSHAEIEAFHKQLGKCWAKNELIQGKIKVSFQMNEDGTFKRNSIRPLANVKQENKRIVDQALKIIHTALVNCENGSYNLPLKKYEGWKTIEVTFSFN